VNRADREGRLAEALRANLRRRKQQQRARSGAAIEAEPADDGGDGAEARTGAGGATAPSGDEPPAGRRGKAGDER
jgi:hypothetical protein